MSKPSPNANTATGIQKWISVRMLFAVCIAPNFNLSMASFIQKPYKEEPVPDSEEAPPKKINPTKKLCIHYWLIPKLEHQRSTLH